MTTRRQIRELTVQALYQLDARGEADMTDIERAVLDAPHAMTTKREAIELAKKAWDVRAKSDEMANRLAPDWPTHRQPPVDRAIIRLAFYEMASGAAPVAVAINEAIELAREYGSEKSPSFVNGILDKMARTLRESGAAADVPKAAPSAEDWLKDALSDARDTQE